MLHRLPSASVYRLALAFFAIAVAACAESEDREIGPFWFDRTFPGGDQIKGFRPFWDEVRNAEGELISTSVLYPLWHQEIAPDAQIRRWSFFNIINREHNAATDETRFDFWPFFFSRDSGAADSPADYDALFPVTGDVPQRFGQDRMSWVFFPLYGRFEKNGMVTTTTPWPFIKTISGEGHQGFELWPVAGHRETKNVSSESFALWPLIYRKRTGPADEPTAMQAGFLPFYALDRSPGYISETYLWPFFGYVDRTEPYRYHATHYLWPFWVQGRGDDRRINRWAPFYSHSKLRGHEKTWVMWPLWRQAEWTDRALLHERKQFLYFVYHSTVQKSLSNPDAAPASKVHLWPFFSAWDNGAGHKQVQVLSPIEVFLPQNDRTRRLWSPLFAIYRYDEDESGETEHRLLWGLLKWSSNASTGTRTVSVGPLARYESSSAGKRMTLLGDQLGLDKREGLRAWVPFFNPSSASKP